MEQAKPTKLFRFFPPEAADFFSSKRLWFSQIKDFNDPFEMLPRYDVTLRHKIEERQKMEFAFLPPAEQLTWDRFRKETEPYIQQQLEEAMQVVPEGFQKQFGGQFGVICFTENLTSLLMWGHYAKGHRGFVVEFDFSHELFQTDGETGMFRNVDYPLQRPEFVCGFKNFAFTKSIEWKDEAEWRLLRVVTNLKLGNRNDGKKLWYSDLPAASVRAVYFGCRMTEEKRKEILDSLNLPEWKAVNHHEMRIHPTNFAVEPLSPQDVKLISKENREKFDAAQTAASNKFLTEEEREWIKRVQ